MKRFAIVLMVACSSRSGPPDELKRDGPITHEERCPGVRAVWTGTREGNYEHYEQLTLELAGGKRWTRDIEDHDSPGFGVFSPDCKRALLLQSRMGPFHVVRLTRLAAYVEGEVPDYELAGEPSEDGVSGTGVFRGGAWVSSREIAYTWGCCEPATTTVFVLPTHHVTPSYP